MSRQYCAQVAMWYVICLYCYVSFAEWSETLSNDKHCRWLTSSKCRYFLCEFAISAFMSPCRVMLCLIIFYYGENPLFIYPLSFYHSNHYYILMLLERMQIIHSSSWHFCGGRTTSLHPFLLFFMHNKGVNTPGVELTHSWCHHNGIQSY